MPTLPTPNIDLEHVDLNVLDGIIAVLERDLADLRALRARRRAVIALSRRRLPRRRPRTPELPSRSVRW